MSRFTLGMIGRMVLPTMTVACLATIAGGEALLIDFNSTTQDGGPHPQVGYQAYNAGHEVAEDFLPVGYSAFGTTVTLTPTWPDTTANTVMQMIDRNTNGPPVGGNDAEYVGTLLDLVTDWIGADARTGSGGNGTDGPTTMELSLSGIPAGDYFYRAYHHDTEFMNPEFSISLTDADGTAVQGTYEVTGSSSHANNPDPVSPGAGNGPDSLTSTVSFPFRSNGSDDVVFQYQVSEGANVHESFIVVNGIEISDQPIASFFPTLTIDRDTGSMILANNTGAPITMLGYTITSGAATLDPGQWTSVAENYDLDSGDQSVDPDDAWLEFSPATDHTELSEGELGGPGPQDGATLVNGQAIDLGAGAWTQFVVEDVEMVLLMDDGTGLPVSTQFVGNQDLAFEAGDFNFDGSIDALDYPLFLAGLHADLASLTEPEAYQMGDMNGDLENNYADTLLFRAAYDAANGPGAFAALVSVPEPTSCVLLGLGGAALLFRRGRSRSPIKSSRSSTTARLWQPLFGFWILCGMLIANPFAAAEVTYVDATEGPGGNTSLLDGSVFNSTADAENDGLWRLRDYANPLGHDDTPNATIFEANNGEDAHMLRTTISGLVPNANYNVFGYLWSDPANWNLKLTVNPNDINDNGTAGDLSDDFLPEDPSVFFSKNGSATSTDAPSLAGRVAGDLDVDADNDGFSDSYFTSPVLVGLEGETDGNRDIYEASLGLATADSNGQILVYIDDATSTADRAWYDGVGYEELFQLTLEVNTNTGATRILNDSGVSLEMNYYEITSETGSLAPAGWSSLDSQGIDAVDGDDPGSVAGDSPMEGWDEAGGIDNEVLSEIFFTDISVLADQASLNLGSGFDPVSGQEDIAFSYGIADGRLFSGLVVYDDTHIDIPGDYNANGQVEQGDLDLVLLNWGDTWPPAVGGWVNGQPTDGKIDQNDLDGVLLNWGNSIASAQAVPEPSSGLGLLLAALTASGLWSRRRKPTRNVEGATMNGLDRMRIVAVTAMGVCLLGASTLMASVSIDRDYKLGEGSGENGTNGAVVGSGHSIAGAGDTLDEIGPSGAYLDLTESGGPTYVNVFSGAKARPGTASGDVGVQFDGTNDQLNGVPLNRPDELASIVGTYPLNYTGIVGRGLQLWVYPDAAAMGSENAPTTFQGIVADTVLSGGPAINAVGQWTQVNSGHLDGAGAIPATVSVAAGDAWYHVMHHNYPTSGNNFLSVLYVDGVAVSANADTIPTGGTANYFGKLVVGAAEVAGDGVDPVYGNYFAGIVDDLEMYVFGDNTSEGGQNWGTFDLFSDNAWIANQIATTVPGGVLAAGDVNKDGAVNGDGSGPVGSDDVSAFLAGWGSEQILPGAHGDASVGDWLTWGDGDLNLDGVTNIFDAYIIHEGLKAAGGAGLDFGLLSGVSVPEPSSLALLGLALGGLLLSRRNRA